MRLWMLAPVLMLHGCVSGPWKDFYNEPRVASTPSGVRRFVINAQGCGHFSGEEPYDAERAAFLKMNIDELCTGLRTERSKLLIKYFDNAAVKDLVAEVWEVFGDS